MFSEVDAGAPVSLYNLACVVLHRIVLCCVVMSCVVMPCRAVSCHQYIQLSLSLSLPSIDMRYAAFLPYFLCLPVLSIRR